MSNHGPAPDANPGPRKRGRRGQHSDVGNTPLSSLAAPPVGPGGPSQTGATGAPQVPPSGPPLPRQPGPAPSTSPPQQQQQQQPTVPATARTLAAPAASPTLPALAPAGATANAAPLHNAPETSAAAHARGVAAEQATEAARLAAPQRPAATAATVATAPTVPGAALPGAATVATAPTAAAAALPHARTDAMEALELEQALNISMLEQFMRDDPVKAWEMFSKAFPRGTRPANAADSAGAPRYTIRMPEITVGKRFTSEDAERHVRLFKLWARNTGVRIADQPLAFTMSIKGDEGKLFIENQLMPLIADMQHDGDTDGTASAPTASDAAKVFAAFTGRWPKPGKSVAERYRDTLFAGNLVQGNSTLQEYVADFQQMLLHVTDMSPADQVRWFRQGLHRKLQQRCIMDAFNNKFSTLQPLIAHAQAEDEKLRVMSNTEPRVSAISTVQKGGFKTPEKKRRRSPSRKGKAAAGATCQRDHDGKRPAAGTGILYRDSGPTRTDRTAPDGARAQALREHREKVAAGKTKSHDPLATTKFTDPVSKRHYQNWEFWYFKNNHYCLNCFAGKHLSKDCPQPKRVQLHSD